MERTHLNGSDGGSKDGSGAADHDQPYQFGRRPRAVAPWPFTERQYAHLLVLRGRFVDQPNPADRVAPARPTAVLSASAALATAERSEAPKKARRRAA